MGDIALKTQKEVKELSRRKPKNIQVEGRGGAKALQQEKAWPAQGP